MPQTAPLVASPKRVRGCSTMVSLSKFVARWMAKQEPVGEDSITDLYLFRLSDRVTRVHYTRFNRVVEGKHTGADWEWWFLYDSGSVVLRVQAKKLVAGDDQYSALAYKNKNGTQIDKLISDAHKRSYLPFYALYHVPDPLDSSLCGAYPARDAGAVFLADAAAIRSRLQGQRPIGTRELIALSTPASCVLCCAKGESPPGADGFHSLLRTTFPAAFSGEDGEHPGRGYIEGPSPAYVQWVYESPSRVGTRLTDDVTPPDDVGAVVVSDLRDRRVPEREKE